MINLLAFPCCPTYSVWPTGSVSDNTTQLSEREIAITTTTPSPIFFDQTDNDAHSEFTIFSDPDTTWVKYELEDKFEKLRTLKISEKTIGTLANYIKNESEEEHKKVLLKNIEWYACACDSISESLSEKTTEHPKTTTIDTNEDNSLLDWLNFIKLYFELHENSNNAPEFTKNLDTFKRFYEHYEQNGNSIKALCKHEIIATLVSESMDEAFLKNILEWSNAIYLSQKFSIPLDLLQCTNYKVNNYIYFVTNKGTTNDNKSILYYVYFKQH